MFEFLKQIKNKKTESLKLNGPEESWQWRDHRIVYNMQGQGTPLLLQHGINAAAWAFEMRHNIEPLSRQYRVYAPDLPGFGRSERKAINYTAELYVEFLADFAHYIAKREGQPPAVIASSLTAAHVIGAVVRHPQSFGPLLLIAPTGLQRLDFAPTEKSTRLHQKLKGPLGSVAFWLLTTRLSTKIFLGRDGYFDPKYIDAELIEGFHKSARQPNAKFAPISFIAFLLNHSVKQEWPTIEQPVLIVWGREAKITPMSDAERFLELRPDTQLEIIDNARLAVYDEQSAVFNKLALNWLSQHYPTKKPANPKAA